MDLTQSTLLVASVKVQFALAALKTTVRNAFASAAARRTS